MNGKVFRVYCNGYSKTVLTIAETQAFIDLLRTRGCVGHEIEVARGRGDLKAAVYDLKNTRRDILKAA